MVFNEIIKPNVVISVGLNPIWPVSLEGEIRIRQHRQRDDHVRTQTRQWPSASGADKPRKEHP